jgi:uncharacterized protein (DUF305 family)
MHTHRLAGVVLTAVVVAGFLAGCGGTANTAPQPPGRATAIAGQQRHNQADITFLQGLLPHHVQSGTMTDLARTKAVSSKVKALAARIKAEQDQQLTRIRDLLGAWGVAIPADGSDKGSVPGMLSDQQMQQLSSASGNDFDQRFLRLMVDHQQGAIQLAQTELAQGSDPQARRIAQDTVTRQQIEINQMQKMLQAA